MAIEGVGAGADVDRRLQQYVRRILDLSQGNKAVYFAISPNRLSGWRVKTRGFKLSDDALHELFGLSKRDSFLLDLLYGYF